MNQSRNPLIDYRTDSAIALKAESSKTIVELLLEISTFQQQKKIRKRLFYNILSSLNKEQSMLEIRKL